MQSRDVRGSKESLACPVLFPHQTPVGEGWFDQKKSDWQIQPQTFLRDGGYRTKKLKMVDQEGFFIYSFTSSSAHSVIHLITVTWALAGDPRDKYNENPIPQGACSPAGEAPQHRCKVEKWLREESRQGGSRVEGKPENKSKNQVHGGGVGAGHQDG